MNIYTADALSIVTKVCKQTVHKNQLRQWSINHAAHGTNNFTQCTVNSSQKILQYNITINKIN